MIEQPSAIEIAALTIGLCGLASRNSQSRLTLAMACVARAVGVGLAVLFGRRDHRGDFGDPRGQRFVDAALVERQRDAMRARQRRHRLDDLAHVGELRKGFGGQERADLEMPHARGIFVAEPALLRRRRRKGLHQLQAIAQAYFAQDHAVIGIDVSERRVMRASQRFCRLQEVPGPRVRREPPRYRRRAPALSGLRRCSSPFHSIGSAGTRNASPSALKLLTRPPGRSTCGSSNRSSGRLIGEKQMLSRSSVAGKIGGVPAFYHLGDARNDPGARQNPVGGGAQGRIVKKFLQPELLAKTLPVAFGDDADENAFAARGLEDVVDRPGMLALRHRARLVAGHLVLDHVLRHQEQAVFEQADADVGALVRALLLPCAAALLVERGEDRDHAEHAAHDVVGG